MNEGDNIKDGRGKDDPRKKDQEKNPLRDITVGAIIVFFLAASMNGLFNFFGHPAIQLFPFFVAVCAGMFFVTYHTALHFRHVPWLFMVWSGISCFLFVLTAKAVDRKLARLAARPHFNVILLNSKSQDSVVELTNSFLFEYSSMVRPGPPQFPGMAILSSSVKGYVFVPINPFDSQPPTLYFGVKNDSEIPYPGSEKWQFQFSYGDCLNFFPEAGWGEVTRGFLDSYRTVWTTLDQNIAANGNGPGTLFPPLELKPCFAIRSNSPCLCRVKIVPDSGKPTTLDFWMFFSPTINRIHIKMFTNEVFTVPSEFSWEKSK